MTLSVVLSSEPRIRPHEGLPDAVARLLDDADERPYGCLWVVPSGRRKRQSFQERLSLGKRAEILPGLHTLESLVQTALPYCGRRKRIIGESERLLRLARCWQDETGRLAGSKFIRQVDRFVRDWFACKLPLPQNAIDPFERTIVRYYRELADDQLFDRVNSVIALTSEINDPDSWLNRIFLGRVETMLFDGFHRLDRVELDVIAALSGHRQVLLWLAGEPGTRSWKNVDRSLEYLRDSSCSMTVHEHFPVPSSPFAGLGRSVFQNRSIPRAQTDNTLKVYRLEANNPQAELEEVARHIKAEYRQAQRNDRAMRLSDAAVVISGPNYDPLVREIFPRAGLEFNLAGRALEVATSRPARILTAVLGLIRGQWRYDLLLNLLNHPLVKRRLDQGDRLTELFRQRPRARQRLSREVWIDSWRRHIGGIERQVDSYEADPSTVPEEITMPPDDYVRRKQAEVAGLSRLVDSITRLLEPVAAMETALEATEDTGGLLPFVNAVGSLLRHVRIDEWLKPPRPGEDAAFDPADPVVPWVEFEKDQQAYHRLLGLLENLAALPPARLPHDDNGRPDALAALETALDAESYQIKTEDDAGVQIFELREIRGLRFRHVYLLGLVHGQLPAIPEEGALASRRRVTPVLAGQLESKESEVEHLFSQAITAAQEKLVLCRPNYKEDQQTLPSPFLAALEDRIELPDLPGASNVVAAGHAHCHLGRAARNQASNISLADLWPGIETSDAPSLQPAVLGMTEWRRLADKRATGTVVWDDLWRLLYNTDRPFSPSELETYAACPFKHFGEYVLKLEERETDPTRMLYGSLVHRALNRFYTQRRTALGTEADEPLPPVTPDDRAALLNAFQAELQTFKDGVIPPYLVHMVTCRGGVADLFLDTMRTVEHKSAKLSGFGNVLCEHVLGQVQLGEDQAGRPVLLTGKIDRVDRSRSDSHEALIIDYKTGKAPSGAELQTKLADGRMLQLPLYAAGLQKQQPTLQPAGGAYVHLREKGATGDSPKKSVAEVGPCLGTTRRDLLEAFDADAAQQLALLLASDIRFGRFPLTRFPVGDKYSECQSYCPLRHACRQPAGYQSRDW